MNNLNKDMVLASRLWQSFRAYENNIAVGLGENNYSYRQLSDTAARIAASLKLAGMANGFAGILAYKSFTAYAAIAGVLFASGGYVPLNPKFPIDRTADMIKRAGISTIILGKECEDYFIQLCKLITIPFNVIIDDGQAFTHIRHLAGNINVIALVNDKQPDLLAVSSRPDDFAYLLFTSGSTGTPKAVAITNENVCSYIDNIKARFPFSSNDRFSQTFDLTFDLSVHDIFVAWLSGATLCIPPGDTPFLLKNYIIEHKINVWFSVPSVAVMLAKMRLLKPGSLPALRYSFFCGEALLEETAISWQKAAPHSEIVNLYGPTEATIAIGFYRLPKMKPIDAVNGIVSIGTIFKNQKYLIDYSEVTDREGELLLSGSQVIHSYFDFSEANTNSFVLKANTNFYRTGDRVKEKNGLLYYTGRMDNEIKISGYRVNLQEIDHVIAAKGSREAVVSIATQNNNGMVSEIVSFVLKDVFDNNELVLLEHCRKKLPWYMLPRKILFVDSFFYNTNGKIDRQMMINMYISSGK